MRRMSLQWDNGKMSIVLQKPDRAILNKAREIGLALEHMNQPTGTPLVDAIDAVLGQDGEEAEDGL